MGDGKARDAILRFKQGAGFPRYAAVLGVGSQSGRLRMIPEPQTGPASAAALDEHVEAISTGLLFLDGEFGSHPGSELATDVGSVRLELKGARGLELLLQAVLVGADNRVAGSPAVEILESDLLKEAMAARWQRWVARVSAPDLGPVALPTTIPPAAVAAVVGLAEFLEVFELGSSIGDARVWLAKPL